MSEKLHVPKPRIMFERGLGALKSSYFAGEIVGAKPFIRLGMKGGEAAPTQAQAVLSHEFGHHAHAKLGVPESMMGVSTSFLQAGRVARERTAWKLVDPFLYPQRPVQKFMKKFALGTYLGTVRGETVRKERS